MALPLIGIRLGASLYCAMLLTYWTTLTFGPAGGADRLDDRAADTVTECLRPSVLEHDRSPVHSPSS